MSGHAAEEEEELSYDAHDWSPQHVLAWIDGGGSVMLSHSMA